MVTLGTLPDPGYLTIGPEMIIMAISSTKNGVNRSNANKRLPLLRKIILNNWLLME
jgi:hypothetical protein